MSIELALIPIAIAVAGAIGNRKKQTNEPPNSFRLETRFKDPRLLHAALESYGCRSVMTGQRVDSALGEASIVFEPIEGGAFDAVFIGNIPLDRAQTFVTDLHDEYTSQVQQQVYRNLIIRSKERGLLLETEEVQEDNSIVLTFAI